MKVTLWQQFSSNHSTYFAIVGRFSDAEAASKSYNLLRDLMQRLLAAKDEQWKEDKLPELSELEEQIILTYLISWYEDGMDWNGSPPIEEVVQHFQNDVFLMCPVETWNSPRPFEELLQKIGATSLIKYVGEPYEGTIHLRCKAPNEEKPKLFAEHTLEELKKSYRQRHYIWTKFDEKSGFYRGTRLGEGKLQLDGQMLDMIFEFLDATDVYILLQYLADNQYTEIEYKFFIPEEK
jgi:hypothetical protein